jgi:glycosyltransferase involved in cell wall biosynthesis
MRLRRPLVSIGIPFFNPGPFLREAIQSVFAQTYPFWELILVDDGSDDGSYELCLRIQDSRVRVFRDGKQMGLAARLNQIASVASGKYLARMDADDLMHPERLARQVALLEAHPEIAVVSTGYYLMDPEGNLLGVRMGVQPKPEEVFAWGGYLHPSIMARTSWFRDNPYALDYPRAEDRELFARVMGQAQFFVLREPLYIYRWYGNTALTKLIRGYRSERRIILRYGPSKLGWPKTWILLGRSLAKEAIVRAVSLFGQEEKVPRAIASRHATVAEEHRIEFERTLCALRSVEVPGWGI